ncbi:Retrovirus-related Pol polyprotein from type-2 retrotransposable element R2DM, partial [Diplonema papillatum]
MATTVPAGVAAALEAGRVGSQYPYAPMKPAEPGWGRDLRRDYVAVPSSLANSPHFSNTIGTPDGQGDAEGLSRRHFIPLKDPAEAMTLSRQLLTLHRAYGTYDVRDQVTPAAAEQVARSILGEWSMSRRANHDSGRRDSAAPWPAAKSPPPVELSPQAKWLAAQREMQDLNDALVQVDAVLPPPCVCPEKQPGYQHSLWDEEKRSEADEVSVRSVSENPEVPVPVDAYGAPVDKEKLYFVAENMIKCGACGAKLLSTARYCHWCQYKVHVKCIDCGDNTRTPATTCIHCQQMLPTISLQDNANMPPHMVPLHRVGRPPVPINNLGHPVDDNKVYFVSYEMEHCGQCNALMLNWSNFCHWRITTGGSLPGSADQKVGVNKRKKKTTACGVDGWRLNELKALPDELLDGFATLFNLVEERGEWPKGMLTSLVSLIPKTDDTSPTNLRPITVTSCVYRLWACRRLQDVMEWQDGWILPSQHGFRRGHRTDDVLMELTTLIEETLLDESKSLYMVALDFAKCFDRVPQGIVLRLAEGMGLDARILRPLRAMYRGMKRRFKLPLGVGSEFEVTNGILQGCPLSVILINALLSIVLRAVSARVPEVSSESLADDATLFASVESELQQAVDVIAQFCALTGMRLNMTKTLAMGIPAGTVRQRRRRPYTSVLAVGDETIPTATAAKILGVRTSVASVQAERTNDARLKAHNALLDRLSTSRLPFDVRCEVASSNVLGSVLAGCSYEGYTQTCLRGLRSRVVKGAFGTKHPSRNVTAVLAILAKAHRMDPLLARPYRILCSLFDTCERLPRVHARMLNIARLYSRHGVLLPKARLGPVGIAISDGFTVAGIDFEGHDFATAALEGRRLLDMERGERHHAIRARLRQTTWTQLARQRPSYDGVQAGVDCRRTNELRLATADAGEKRALAVILSGGVFLAARWGRNARANGGAAGTDGSPSSSASVSSTASDTTGSFDEHVSESSSSEPQRPPLDRGCRDCDLGVQDTADHLWWECPAYDEIRGRPCFAELLRADRARWPSCTRVHGVIVEGMRVEVAALHRLMAAVYTARVEAERRRLSAVQPMHPWHAAAPLPAVQHLFDFDRLPDEPPRWPYGGRAMRALKGWLSALRWTNAGEVSCVELAVDFEVHTGVDVPAPPGIRRLAANQRGKTLWTMLSTLCRLCQDLQLPSPLPAERKVRVGSMRTLGAPMLWGGLTPRPRFAGGEETHGVLGTSFPRAAAGDGKNWGGDVFPQYDAARRAQRSLRWDVPTPLPQRPRLPVLVPAAQADPLLRTQSVCDACAKQKCA